MATFRLFNDNYIKTMRWTIDSIRCYERHCICEGCDMKQIFPRCMLKYSVGYLLDEKGEPDKNSKIYKKAIYMEEE